MERTKGVVKAPVNTVETMEEGQVRFKKVGGGSLRLHNRIIKPGQIFIANPSDIPKSFRDLVIALDKNVKWEVAKSPAAAPVPITPAVVTKPVYVVKKREGSQWYDVLDGQGKVLNERGLKKEVAENFVEDLLK